MTDKIITKPPTPEYEASYERVFHKKHKSLTAEAVKDCLKEMQRRHNSGEKMFVESKHIKIVI